MDALFDIFLNVISSFGSFFFMLVFCSYVLSRISGEFFHLFGRASNVVLMIFGGVGTAIHEISHFVVAKIFGFKVKGVKLFNFPDENGTIGSVSISYKKSIKSSIGLFFVGISPVYFGVLMIVVITILIVPNFASSTGLDSLDGFTAIFSSLFDMAGNFASSSDNIVLKVIYVYLLFNILSQIAPSTTDLRIAFRGFVVSLLVIIVPILLILSIVSTSLVLSILAGLEQFTLLLLVLAFVTSVLLAIPYCIVVLIKKIV